MEQNILVSFIITTYNLPPDRLEECIGSIMKLSLNPKEREIILVDDGSALLLSLPCPTDRTTFSICASSNKDCL